MSILVLTPNPKSLLASIKREIASGAIVTWSCDTDGDFTHSPPQWDKKAWLRPVVGSGILQFGLLGQTSVKMSKEIYGIYHGRFVEMLLVHFDNDFSNAMATSQKDATVDVFK